MKKSHILFIALVIAMALIASSFTAALARDTMPTPLDPQNWQLHRDKTWDDIKPNPMINWLTEHNIQGIQRPSALRNSNDKTPIAGGLIMIEYLDRKFISRGDIGSDPLGYYLYKQDGSGLEDSKTNNPIYNVPQLVADEKYGGDISKVTDTDFANWWADYLNKPQKINHGLTINEAWRENSYGKWVINLTAYGPYTIPYFEFETMGYDQGSSFQTYRDQPPSFRRGSSGTSNGFSFDSVSATYVDSVAATGQFTWDNVDFFFWLHAGYDESGVWQEFGMNQFASRKDIPHELGPGLRMKKVEQFFTENPQWLSTYASRYNGGSNSSTTTRDFWAGELTKYNATQVVGYSGPAYEFHLSQADWDWVDGYNDQTQKNTRYVNFTSWEAAVGEWSHMSSISRNGRTIRYSTQGENDGMSAFAHEFGHIGGLGDNYGNPYTARVTAATEPWELMSRGAFSGPFGDHARWTVPGVEGSSVPVHYMTYNKIQSSYYDNNDLLIFSKQDLASRTPVVAEIVARNIPLNNNKTTANPQGLYPWLEEYGLVSPNYYKGIRINFASGTGIWGDQATAKTQGFSQFGATIGGGRMGIEVVQRTGYDSFAPDDGVILSRNNRMIDSHNYDIALIDYTVENGLSDAQGIRDDHVSYTVGHAAQLWDGAFHVGKSFTDTGYYRTIYSSDPADDYGTVTSAITQQEGPRYYGGESSFTWQKGIIKRGSIKQWEPRDGREIASGETINEWHDTANNMHFYILAKNTHEGRFGEFISYTVGVLHGAGTSVGGALEVDIAELEAETPGKVAVANFKITNTGDATDIVRVGVTGDYDPVILNDLYAIEAGETITVPVYVQFPYGIRTLVNSSQKITLTASSESNGAKVGEASVLVEKLVATNYEVYLLPSKDYYIVGQDVLVDVFLKGDINYTQIAADVVFDAELLKYEAYTYLSGWVAAVTPGAGKVSIRSMPTSNMVVGAPCLEEVKVATLKFSLKDVIEEISTETALTLQNVLVTPAGSMKDFGTTPTLPASLTLIYPAPGPLTDVVLISGAELEIAYPKPIPNDYIAQAVFDINVGGEPVEWEYLSYFDFGPYAKRGGVLNIRLKDALDAGEPRGRRRTSVLEEYLDRTEHVKGPAAAASLAVAAANSTTKAPVWDPFYMERSQGYMSRYYAYASQKAGNNGTVLLLNDEFGTPATNFYDARNVFNDTTKLYTDEFVARMVGESMNHLTGRAEYLNLPMIYDGFVAYIVGPAQSVYEAPQYRELYVYGETEDAYTRRAIKASDVPGNLNWETNKFKKPFIIGTSDDIFSHDSPIDASGELTSLSGSPPARPQSNHFSFGEAFFDAFYHLGVVRGCQNYPRTSFNEYEDFAFDLHLEEAYAKAQAAGMWPNTKMMESLKDYYIGGALTHFEMMSESQDFAYDTWPINTRAELEDYDYPLFWALCGIHSQYQFWAGTGTGQSVDANNDTWKYHTPWFWQNQIDEYGLPATPDGKFGVPYPPLAIEKVEVVDHNAVHVTFNREVKTLQAASQAANWRIYIDGREITPTMQGGYTWKAIRLTTNHAVNYQTGASTSNAQNRLDNGKPYGRYFSGFTSEDIEERKVANGGWIANTQQPGLFALEPGEFVSVQDAISKYGAGMAGKIEVAYVGGASAAPQVLDWSGNELEKNMKVEATFMPWVGNVYRTALTGFYIYLDSKVGTKDYYMYRNEPEGFVQPGAKEVALAAGHQYDSQFTNNLKVTYPTNAGGAAFDYAITGNSIGDWNLTAAPSWGLDYTWTGDGSARMNSGQVISQGPVTYDRPGQVTIDGYVRQSGGLMIAAGNVRGGHPRNLPHRGRFSTGLGESLRVEGNGGNLFDTIDAAILRDYNLSLYRNESLVHHEGGHGIDSAQQIYAQHLFNDITSAFIAATAPKNGMRWYTVDGVRNYVISTSNRSEYVSNGATFYSGVMREQFEGIGDGVWTPVSNRYEYSNYDPYGFEAMKRLFFSGDLGLWYTDANGNPHVGDPAYRVIPEDWELLRDTYPQFSHWTSVNNLIAWGLTLAPTATNNPYTGQRNPLVRWISFNNPCIWQPEPYAEPTREGWRANIRFDFVGRNPYYPVSEGEQPTKSMEHPFYAGSGIKMPVRPAQLAALVAPVSGIVVEGSITIPRLVLVQFKFANPSGVITMNNAPSSFEVYVDGEPTHFYFWAYEKEGDVATVTLRLEWPLEGVEVVTVKALAASVEVQEAQEVVEEIAEFEMLQVFEETAAEAIAETIVIIE